MLRINNGIICVMKEESEMSAKTISYTNMFCIVVAAFSAAEPVALSMAVQKLCRPLWRHSLCITPHFKTLITIKT